MCEKFDIKVDIGEDLMKTLVFGINARPPIGLILGFSGYSHEVMPLMQTLSHTTRAFTCNADGLPNFVMRCGFI